MLSKRQIETTSRDNDYVSLAIRIIPADDSDFVFGPSPRISMFGLGLGHRCAWDQYDEHTETKYMPDLFNRFDLCLQYLRDTFNAPVGEIDAHYQLQP